MSRVTVTPNARHRVPLAARVELEKLLDDAPEAYVNVSASRSRGPIFVRASHYVDAPGGKVPSPLFHFEGDPDIVLRKAADALAAYIDMGAAWNEIETKLGGETV